MPHYYTVETQDKIFLFLVLSVASPCTESGTYIGSFLEFHLRFCVLDKNIITNDLVISYQKFDKSLEKFTRQLNEWLKQYCKLPRTINYKVDSDHPWCQW